jgi:hypothetical protein
MMRTRFALAFVVVTILLLAACTAGSHPASGPVAPSGAPGPIPSAVVSSLELRATPTAAGPEITIGEGAAVTSARRWLLRAGAWRPTAQVRASLVRFTAFGLDDAPAWLVYAFGVHVPWTGQPHIIVVIDARTGARLGDYVF